MSKAKLKQSTEKLKTVKKRRITPDVTAYPKAGEPNAQALDAQKIVQIWQEEVNTLSAQTFKNEKEAISAIVKKVVMRLKTPKNLQAATQNFLEILFETDPAIMDEIRRFVRISR